MDEKLVTEIKAVVESIFSQKEEAEMRDQTEAELKRAATTIEDLTTKLEHATESASKKDETISELEDKVKSMQSDLEKANKDAEAANEKLEITNKTLEEMKKDKAAEDRMSVLDKAGVARTDKEAQSKKVREMTDEEFASYKDELVSIRASIVEELKTKESEVAEEVEDTETASEEEEVTTPPAKVDPKETANNILNMEVASAEIKDKFKGLGDALAKRMLGDRAAK